MKQASKYTLVVVDMQSNFTAANDARTVANVGREIRAAMAGGHDVVVVSIPYWSPMDEEGLPPVHPQLTKLLVGYPHQASCSKLSWQYGGSNVVNCCQRGNLGTERFRLVGVNAGGWIREANGALRLDRETGKPLATGCVFCMAIELSQVVPNAAIEVVQDACNDPGSSTNWNDYLEISPNIVLIPPAAECVERVA